MAHYMKNEDDVCIKFMDTAIDKGPVDHDMYYYKGMALFYKEDFSKSLAMMKKAIDILPDEPAFYKSTGEVFYYLKENDSAYAYLKKAVSYKDARADDYALLAEVCSEMGKAEEAVAMYNSIVQVLNVDSEDYHRYLYNYCLLLQLNKQYSEAEINLKQLLEYYPDDYDAKSKLIQVSIAQDKHDSINTYKSDLYKAYKEKKISEELGSRFCFEQFEWKNNTIMAFENYQEPEDSDDTIFNKHQYFVFDEKGEYLYEVNSESSFAVRMNENVKYVLALKYNKGYKTYWQFSFKDTDYKKMKENVLKILNEEAAPGSATTFGNSKQ